MVIGHRGASGYAPAAHTVESYRLAVAQGADCVECDVVVTKDLRLVCNHDAWLSDTTDAAARHADRVTTYNLPEAGGNVTGVFAMDLTLAEVRALRVRHADPQFWFRDRRLEKAKALRVATFEEYLDVVTSPANARVVCAIPEVKVCALWVQGWGVVRRPAAALCFARTHTTPHPTHAPSTRHKKHAH